MHENKKSWQTLPTVRSLISRTGAQWKDYCSVSDRTMLLQEPLALIDRAAGSPHKQKHGCPKTHCMKSAVLSQTSIWSLFTSLSSKNYSHKMICNLDVRKKRVINAFSQKTKIFLCLSTLHLNKTP